MPSDRPLPRPLLDVYEWQDQGACSHEAPTLFFEPELTHRARGKEREALAKGICRRCPVMALCRAHGLAVEDHGIWGGLSAREREVMRRNGQWKIA